MKLSCYFSKLCTNIYPCLHIGNNSPKPLHRVLLNTVLVSEIYQGWDLGKGPHHAGPRVSCILFGECPSLLTKQVGRNDTTVPLTQNASIFWGKECKIATALKIYVLVYTRKGLLRQPLGIFGLRYMHFHCLGLSSCYHSNFPYTSEKNTDGEMQ